MMHIYTAKTFFFAHLHRSFQRWKIHIRVCIFRRKPHLRHSCFVLRQKQHKPFMNQERRNSVFTLRLISRTLAMSKYAKFVSSNVSWKLCNKETSRGRDGESDEFLFKIQCTCCSVNLALSVWCANKDILRRLFVYVTKCTSDCPASFLTNYYVMPKGLVGCTGRALALKPVARTHRAYNQK